MKLNLRSIDLNLLPIFEAIMEAGQYSRAAERLAMSQPAMSAAVQRLRTTLDDPLFVRTSKGVVPTAKAHEVYKEIHGAMNQLRQGLTGRGQFDPSGSDDSFRIMSGDYFEFVMLPRLLNVLEIQAPKVSIRVQAMDQDPKTQLLHGHCQMILDAFPISDERIVCEEIMQEELVVIARKDHPLLNKQTMTSEEFFQLKHAVLPERGRELPLDKILARTSSVREQVKERIIAVQVGQYSSLLAVVSSSDCIATVPRALAKRYSQSLGLSIYDFPLEVPPVPVYMMWSKAYDQDPALRWLLKTFRDLMINAPINDDR